MGQSTSSQKKPPEDEKASTTKELFLAVSHGDEKTLIRLLESRHAKYLPTAVIDDKMKRTALHVASLHGHHHCVDRLLAGGSSLKSKDAAGQTALMLASSRCQDECVGSLLKAGSSANAVDLDGQSPLHLASGVRGDSGVSCVQRLLDHGGCVNAQDCSGWAPLHWACREGVSECANLLLQHGADKHVQSNLYWTPLHEAAREGHAECVRILLEAKACPDALDTTMTSPLIDSMQNFHLDCAQLLLSYEASANGPGVREASDKRPLHLALKMNYVEAVELLFKFGADPSLKSMCDGSGNFQSAFDLVERCNQATKEVFGDCCLAYNFPYAENNRVRSLLSLSRITLRQAVCPDRISRVNELGLPEVLISFVQYSIKRDLPRK